MIIKGKYRARLRFPFKEKHENWKKIPQAARVRLVLFQGEGTY